MPYIGTCFRFYMQMQLQKKAKHLHIEFIVTSHNSVSKEVALPDTWLKKKPTTVLLHDTVLCDMIG